MSDAAPHADHFASAEQQAHAARLGMWIFLGSELLLFAGLFALYAVSRMRFPDGFAEGVAGAEKVAGSLNTAVLLVSSTLVASSMHALHTGRPRLAAGLVATTAALGALFVAVKLGEYHAHIAQGIVPGGRGPFFDAHPTPGLAVFWSLYFVVTGLHAIHVTVGVGLLAFTGLAILRGRVSRLTPRRLELTALYWHLVDLIWIVLWPLFYLA